MQTAPSSNGTFHKADEIKRRAAGRWLEILEHVAGIDPALLDGRHHPCPKCGGTDRFRLIDADAGAVICNHCFKQGNGDGLPTSSMAEKFARVFRGVHVVVIPDRDEAGAQKTATRVRGVAASVKIATLPGEWKETGGDDVRDVLAKPGGEKLLRDAIADAVEWKPGDDCEAEAPKQERRRITLITSEELAKATFKQDYFVEGVLAKDQHGVASGPKKAMKTGTMIDLAMSVASGRPFLEKFFTNKSRVGIFSGESGQKTIQETAFRIAKAKGMPLQNFDVLWSFDLPQFDHFDDLRQVRSHIENNGLELVILDPAYLCMNLTDGASNLFAVGEKLQILTNLGKETGATIILCHHNRKGLVNPYEPPELEDMYGSGFAEWARQWILFGRRCRFDPEDPNGLHELWLN